HRQPHHVLVEADPYLALADQRLRLRRITREQLRLLGDAFIGARAARQRQRDDRQQPKTHQASIPQFHAPPCLRPILVATPPANLRATEKTPCHHSSKTAFSPLPFSKGS